MSMRFTTFLFKLFVHFRAFRLRRRAFRYIFFRFVTFSLPKSASASKFRPRYPSTPPLQKDAASIPNA